MLKKLTKQFILFATIGLFTCLEGMAQVNTNISLDQFLPGSSFTNPSLQIPPNSTGDINFRILDLYDEQTVIPSNQYDNLNLMYDSDIVRARMVPSIVFSPRWDGFLRGIILGSIPDKVFEYDERDIELRPYFNNY